MQRGVRTLLWGMEFLAVSYAVAGSVLMLSFLAVFALDGATGPAALLFYTLLAFSVFSRLMVALFAAFIILYGYFYWRFGLRRFIADMAIAVLAFGVAILLHHISEIAAHTGWS